MIRGVRGATTVYENNEAEILDATEELVRVMCEANNIEPADVAQVLITVTEDLPSTFPAKALRRIEGWTFVPVMCALEIPVPNSLPRCIRVMMTVNTALQQEDVQHIYLHDAVKLRPDLKLTKDS
ncbi:chorismate mutase [Halalkalibacterium ligniniphilum]|uniref:chorismate mutase n=1 Tax=Halalkalibacterium ligniniphilum TaxID=1134413 RepID=UPI00034D8514|nr:chorismate mutase [Halalkalibacterium ligniniphilum]